MSLNLGNSKDIYGTNKCQRLRYSVDWTYLYNGFCKDLRTLMSANLRFFMS